MTDSKRDALAAALHEEWDRRTGEPSEPGVACVDCRDSADTLRDRVRKALHDWGLDALTADPPHDWRCQYTDRFPEPCTCVDDLVEDIVEAVYGPQEDKP